MGSRTAGVDGAGFDSDLVSTTGDGALSGFASATGTAAGSGGKTGTGSFSATGAAGRSDCSVAAVFFAAFLGLAAALAVGFGAATDSSAAASSAVSALADLRGARLMVARAGIKGIYDSSAGSAETSFRGQCSTTSSSEGKNGDDGPKASLRRPESAVSCSIRQRELCGQLTHAIPHGMGPIDILNVEKDLGDHVGNGRHLLLLHAPRGHGGGAKADAAPLER